MPTSDTEQSLRITELRAENFKRIKAVNIRPDGAMVQITGRNDQGKSSTLDCIQAALGGRKLEPPIAVRDGTMGGSIELIIGNKYKAVKRWDKSGKSTLTLTDATGRSKLSSPQSLLNEIVGDLTFDPLAFSLAKPAEQMETLKRIAGVDVDGFDQQREQLYTQRTEVNREAARLKGVVAQTDESEFEGVPDEPTDTSEIEQKIATAKEPQRQYDEATAKIARLEQHYETLVETIEELRLKLAECEKKAAEITEQIKAESERANAIDVPDVSELSAKLTELQRQNRLVEKKQDFEALKKQLRRHEQESKVLTEEIHALDDAKREAIASADLPIEGLGLGDDCVTYNGIPFEQAASSVRLRVSAAMAIAMNPKLRIMLIRDGSLLDTEGLAMLEQMAEEHDMQIWIERVTNGEPVGIVIEDGMVAE